jgi:hypothetical protein
VSDIALRREIRPQRPSRDHLWIAGAWDWRGNDWAWEPGRWDRPAYHGAKWNKARYVREGSAWRYEPGHWKGQHLVEGDDYRRWHAENDGRHDERRDRDHR